MTYGIALKDGVLTLWVEDAGRRGVIRAVLLAEDTVKAVREAMMRVKSFRGFGRLFFFRGRLCVGEDGRARICGEAGNGARTI